MKPPVRFLTTAKGDENMGTIILDEKGTKLDYSTYIECIPNPSVGKPQKVRIILGTVKEESSPCCTYNMQTDYADFESLAFSIWSVCENCEIELEFEPFKFYKDKLDISNLYRNNEIDSKIQHYMRFLYRAWKMETLYERFSVSEEKNKKEVDDFGEQYSNALKEGYLQYSAPDCKAGIKRGKSVTENHLEKWFALNGYKDEKSELDLKLYDQLPCGVFFGKHASDCHKTTRIFNKGAIDLWGINRFTNQICIFELKEKSNMELGIISELFFYSCVIQDILEIGKGQRRSNYRGFQELWNENVNPDIIQAYFLVDSFHSFIENHLREVVEAMNKRSDGRVRYNYIKFDQDTIVSPDENGFIKKLIGDWKNNG